MGVSLKVVGIVSEFNPFHNGHAHLIEQVRLAAGSEPVCIVAVMSGHFVQRGEPALMPKAQRVQAAVAGGVDLVLELPTPWSLSSAEAFATGGVSLLHALCCVDTLAFGSECGEIERLTRAADLMETPRFSELLRYHLDGGISFPEAQEKALYEIGGERASELLRTPNNVLGLEYIKAIRRLGSTMRPFTVRRLGAEHDDLRPFGDVASAAYLRTLIRENHLVNALPFMPTVCREAVSAAVGAGLCPADSNKLESAILYRLRQMTQDDFAALPAMSEGLQNRLYAAAQKAGSVEEFLTLCKTRRYPLTRLQRALWCAFLGVTAEDAAGTPPYLRPLGVTDRGMEVLRAAKSAGCTLPIFSRVSQAELLPEQGKRIWQIECRAADLYALALPTPPPCGVEHTTAIFKYQP